MKHQLTEEDVEQFVRKLYIEDKSQATMRKYRHDINVFLDFLGGMDVDKDVVLRYKESLRSTYRVTSANSMLAALNHFFRFLDWEDCCVKTLKTQRGIQTTPDRYLSLGEYQKLLITAEQENVRLARIMETICTTGIRIGELHFVTAEALKKGCIEITCRRKERVVYMAPGLIMKLTDYCWSHAISSGPVFITNGGKPLDRSNIWTDMKRLCERAEVDPSKVSPHNLRHLYIYTGCEMERNLLLM